MQNIQTFVNKIELNSHFYVLVAVQNFSKHSFNSTLLTAHELQTWRVRETFFITTHELMIHPFYGKVVCNNARKINVPI